MYRPNVVVQRSWQGNCVNQMSQTHRFFERRARECGEFLEKVGFKFDFMGIVFMMRSLVVLGTILDPFW